MRNHITLLEKQQRLDEWAFLIPLLIGAARIGAPMILRSAAPVATRGAAGAVAGGVAKTIGKEVAKGAVKGALAYAGLDYLSDLLGDSVEEVIVSGIITAAIAASYKIYQMVASKSEGKEQALVMSPEQVEAIVSTYLSKQGQVNAPAIAKEIVKVLNGKVTPEALSATAMATAEALVTTSRGE